MNVNKRNNYQLTGSIHTLSLISLPVTDIDESIAPCFDTLSSRENLSYSKINANKLVGDLFSYDEFKTAFDTILGGAGIESYSLSRFDMRFDSFDPEHYRDYAKLNRYLISALAVTYNVQNCYDSRNLFSQKQVSVAIKNKRFECENYDKAAESGGRDPAYARLELRSKKAVTALNKAYEYITENCVDWEYPVHIGISTDYHDNQSSIQTVYNFYKQQCKFDVRLHQVDLSDAKQLALTYSGRAKALTNINEYLDPINHKICTAADGKVLCMLDLTLTGNFVLATQHSFQDADNPENILCPVDGNLLLAIMQWNYKHPLNCEEVKVKAWTQHTLDTGNYFGKKATAHDYEICKQSLEYYNDTEIYRKEVHEQFPALYPDDIENISNMSEEKSYLCCQIQATLLQRMRSSTPIDTSCWCTCPKKESQN